MGRPVILTCFFALAIAVKLGPILAAKTSQIAGAPHWYYEALGHCLTGAYALEREADEAALFAERNRLRVYFDAMQAELGREPFSTERRIVAAAVARLASAPTGESLRVAGRTMVFALDAALGTKTVSGRLLVARLACAIAPLLPRGGELRTIVPIDLDAGAPPIAGYGAAPLLLQRVLDEQLAADAAALALGGKTGTEAGDVLETVRAAVTRCKHLIFPGAHLRVMTGKVERGSHLVEAAPNAWRISASNTPLPAGRRADRHSASAVDMTPVSTATLAASESARHAFRRLMLTELLWPTDLAQQVRHFTFNGSCSALWDVPWSGAIGGVSLRSPTEQWRACDTAVAAAAVAAAASARPLLCSALDGSEVETPLPLPPWQGEVCLPTILPPPLPLEVEAVATLFEAGFLPAFTPDRARARGDGGGALPPSHATLVEQHAWIVDYASGRLPRLVQRRGSEREEESDSLVWKVARIGLGMVALGVLPLLFCVG